MRDARTTVPRYSTSTRGRVTQTQVAPSPLPHNRRRQSFKPMSGHAACTSTCDMCIAENIGRVDGHIEDVYRYTLLPTTYISRAPQSILPVDSRLPSKLEGSAKGAGSGAGGAVVGEALAKGRLGKGDSHPFTRRAEGGPNCVWARDAMGRRLYGCHRVLRELWTREWAKSLPGRSRSPENCVRRGSRKSIARGRGGFNGSVGEGATAVRPGGQGMRRSKVARASADGQRVAGRA